MDREICPLPSGRRAFNPKPSFFVPNHSITSQNPPAANVTERQQTPTAAHSESASYARNKKELMCNRFFHHIQVCMQKQRGTEYRNHAPLKINTGNSTSHFIEPARSWKQESNTL